MKNQKSFLLVLFAALVFVCLQTAAFGQTDGKLASVSGGSSVRWDITVPNSGLTLIVSAPDGRTFQRA